MDNAWIPLSNAILGIGVSEVNRIYNYVIWIMEIWTMTRQGTSWLRKST